MEQVKINLGCGNKHAEGYTNIDMNEECSPDILCDVLEGLPYEDNSVDVVMAFDFLEHVPFGKTIQVMEEIWRVLKHHGTFESLTPDVEYGQGAFQDPTHVSFWCENSWLYYSGDGIRRQYGIKANFDIGRMERINSDVVNRVFHLHVLARAVKA